MSFEDIARRHKLRWALDLMPDKEPGLPNYDDLNTRDKRNPLQPLGKRLLPQWALSERRVGARLIATAPLITDEDYVADIQELLNEVREIRGAAKDPVFQHMCLGQELAMTKNGGWEAAGPIADGTFHSGRLARYPREWIIWSEIFRNMSGLDDRMRAQHLRTALLLDVLAPMGHGQRGLLISPPKGGKTHILTTMLVGSTQLPDIETIGIFVRERPEEAQEIPLQLLESAGEQGKNIQLCISTYDQVNVRHTVRMVLWTLERVKRYAEVGKKAFCVIDSLTRLARVIKMVNAGTAEGGFDTGGLDDKTAQVLQRIFGVFRALNRGGAVTGIATILTSDDKQKGSKFEQVVYELFKGTGNWDVLLDYLQAQLGVRPAINPALTGTRMEELLVPGPLLNQMREWRRRLSKDPGTGGPTAIAVSHAKRAIKTGATVVQMVNYQPGTTAKPSTMKVIKQVQDEDLNPREPFDASQYLGQYKNYLGYSEPDEEKYYADADQDPLGLEDSHQESNPNWRADLARVNGA